MVEITANDKRKEDLKALIEKGQVVLMGDALVTEDFTQGQGRTKPVGTFGLNPSAPDVEKVWFCTPHGIPLFEADELHKFAIEKTKENFMKYLDTLIKQKIGVAKAKETSFGI